MLEIKAQGKTAEILIYDDIGGDMFGDGLTAKGFATEIKALGKLERLDVRVNSAGGSVIDGLAIYNTLLRNPAQVEVSIDGAALSIASVIAMAGDVVRMAETAFFMIHDPYMAVIGNAAEMRAAAEELDRIKSALVTAYERQTEGSRETIETAMAKETWYTATEALEAGFVDEVTGAAAIAARARGDWDRLKYKHVPDALVQPERVRCDELALKRAKMQKVLKKMKL